MSDVIAVRRAWGWALGVTAVALALTGAPGGPPAAHAAVAALPPGQIARQAYDGVRTQPHHAEVELFTSLIIRFPGRRIGIAGHEFVGQRVDGRGGADGFITTRPKSDLFGLSSGVTRARMLITGGAGYLFAPQVAARPLAGGPASLGGLWALANPSSPLVRFPNATVVPEFAIVPSPDPAIVRLRGEIPERMAGRFIDAVTRGPGSGGSLADVPLSPDFDYVANRVTLDVDATTGRLRKTTVEVQLRIVLGDPDLIDTAVGDLVFRTTFVPSNVGASVARIARPRTSAPVTRVVRNLVSDERARTLLASGALDMERLRAKLDNYLVTLRDLRIVSDGINYRTEPGARSWRDEISLRGLARDGYRLSTLSRSGRLFRLARLPGVARLHGSCTNPDGTPCRNWRPQIEVDGATAPGDDSDLRLEFASGASSLRIGVELLRHMAANAR